MGKKSDPLASKVPVREKLKELGGLFFFLCAMFVFISLVSYDAGDIREIKYPPNIPLHNKYIYQSQKSAPPPDVVAAQIAAAAGKPPNPFVFRLSEITLLVPASETGAKPCHPGKPRGRRGG